MALELPDWYRGGYPDVEKLLRTLFAPLLANTHVVSWIPKPSTYNDEITAGRGYLRIYRTGGAINYTGARRDEPRVQFAALRSTRDESWELIEFVRQVLSCFVDNGAIVPGTPTKLHAEGEVVGPQLIPELLQDDRLVPITFELHTWKPKGLPDYRVALNLNDL
jgi:hypothetical protein